MRQTSFKVVNSNDLSVLAAVCAEIIAKHPLSDPMKSEIVLVMNGGMQTYLSQEIAHHNGVSAGTEYQQIWVFIWDLYKRLFKESDTLNRFSRDSISWSLLALKQAWSGICTEDHDDKALRALHERFAGILKPLATYVRDDDESGIKSWQLCHRIADTFDQYQMNRPEWIRLFNELSYEDFDEYEKNPEFHGKVYGALREASPEGIRAKDGIAVQWRQNVWQMLLWLRRKPHTPRAEWHCAGCRRRNGSGAIRNAGRRSTTTVRPVYWNSYGPYRYRRRSVRPKGRIPEPGKRRGLQVRPPSYNGT